MTMESDVGRVWAKVYFILFNSIERSLNNTNLGSHRYSNGIGKNINAG